MKKNLLIIGLLFIILISLLTSYENKKKFVNFNTLKVGAYIVPHWKILNNLKNNLKKRGIKLKIITYTDLLKMNQDLIIHKLDANYGIHLARLKKYNKIHKTDLIPVCKVHMEPMRIYSPKYNSVKGIPKNAKVVIIKKDRYKRRTLYLLKDAGLIHFKNVNKFNPHNPIDNPKHLKFIPKNINNVINIMIAIISKDALKLKKMHQLNKLPKLLKKIDLICIQPNDVLIESLIEYSNIIHLETDNKKYILLIQNEYDKYFNSLTGINSIFKEKIKKSCYFNALIVNKGDEENDNIKILKNLLNSKKTIDYINAKFKGIIIPFIKDN